MNIDPNPTPLATLLEERIGPSVQQTAVDALGVSQSTISRWISGSLVPGDDKVEKLAAFLSRPEAEIVLLLHQARRQRQSLLGRVDVLEREVQALQSQVSQVLEQLARLLAPQSSRSSGGAEPAQPLDR